MRVTPLAALLVSGTLACREQVTTAPTSPAASLDIATARLVVEGPFSFRARVGTGFQAYQMNDRGDLVGALVPPLPGVSLYAFIPGSGGPVITLPSPVELGVLFALNEVGVAAGQIRELLPSGAIAARPFRWAPGVELEIGPFLPGPTGAPAVIVNVIGLNDAGTVVGSYGDLILENLPYRWSVTGMELLSAAGGFGFANDINSTGLTVGTLTGSSLPFIGLNGVFWSAAGALTFRPDAKSIHHINEAGQTSGVGLTPGCLALWDADGSVLWQSPCGAVPAVVDLGLNDLGHLLYYGPADDDPVLAYRLKVEGFAPARLPAWPAAGTTTAAAALNNVGRIVGYARNAMISDYEPLYWTYRIEPIPPDELVEDLVDAVDAAEAAGALGAGNANALRAKLDAVSRHLAAGRCEAAANVLSAFVNQVNALEESGRLSSAAAEELRAAAEAAVAELEASCT
jgi:hypothetical protein